MKRKRKRKYQQKTRCVFYFLLIECIVLVLFCVVLDKSKPVDISQIKEASVIVEDTTYINSGQIRRFHIICDSETYIFSAPWLAFGEYPLHELSKEIHIGDQLVVRYHERQGLSGVKKWIIDARSENNVYRSIDDYIESTKGVTTSVLIAFGVIELFIITIFVFWFLYLT